MLESQKKFIQYFTESLPILEKYQLDVQGAKSLQSSLEKGELIVPVVGGFSVGKSTLINSFLGQDILLTAITPETALATELHYTPSEEYIEAVISDDQPVQRFAINEMDKIKENASQYQYTRIYLNNERLKELYPLILVDMPGFEAPNEAHRKAIEQYLARGDYFLILFSVDEGAMSNSMRQEIKRLQSISAQFSIGITKTNLKSQATIDEVKAYLVNNMQQYFNQQVDITLFDNNGGDNLHNLLKTIDPNELFFKQYGTDINTFHRSQLRLLFAEKSVLESSTDETQKTINLLEKDITNLENNIKNEIQKIQRSVSVEVDNTIQTLQQALNTHQAQLVNILVQQGDIQPLINNIITDTVQNALGTFLDHTGHSVISNVTQGLQGLSISLQNGIALDVTNILNSGKQLISNLHQRSTSILENNTARSTYRTIASVAAITTGFINPIIEVALVFLPDIIAFFTQKRQAQQQQQLAEQKLLVEVFPAVKSKLRQSLPALFQEQANHLCEAVQDQFAEQLNTLKEQLTKAQSERTQNETERQNQINTIQISIKNLELNAKNYLMV